jgi:uncharacterized membrane protein YkgB
VFKAIGAVSWGLHCRVRKNATADLMVSFGAKASTSEKAGNEIVESLYKAAARLDRVGFAMLRLGLVIVFCWIGGLKAANYEAEGIVPLVANSPLMSFFYQHSAPDYREQNAAGGLNVENHQWNETNETYIFSYGLGCVIVGLGILIALHPVFSASCRDR